MGVDYFQANLIFITMLAKTLLSTLKCCYTMGSIHTSQYNHKLALIASKTVNRNLFENRFREFILTTYMYVNYK